MFTSNMWLRNLWLCPVTWVCLAGTILLSNSVNSAVDYRWPAFLGAGADGVESDRLPISWNPESNTRWIAELPSHGQSSPVVWGQRLFVTSVEGPKKETYHVTCFDISSGSQLWHQTLENSVPYENSLYVSRAAPTPVVDGQRMITFFESGDCVAWSHGGDKLWQRNLNADYGPLINKFGLSASPCQTDEHVFILLDHEGPSCLLALDKASGETAWKSERSPRQSWSSPGVVHVDNNPQIVVSSQGSVDGYDPVDGQVLWSINDVGGNTGVTPIDCGNNRFLIGASPGRQGEHAEAAKLSNGLLEVSREGNGFTVRRLWVTAEASPSWASPIVHQGLAYWINRVGVIHCFDAETGDLVYTKRTKQSCWATPLAAGDKIYWFGKDGLCTIIAAGREYKVLSENTVWSEGALVEDALPIQQDASAERQAASANFSGPTVYGYAVAGDRIIVRIGKQLFCLSE